MKIKGFKKIKIVSLVITGILFIIPYVDEKYSGSVVLVLSGITLTIYIVAAVLEQREKTGHW